MSSIQFIPDPGYLSMVVDGDIDLERARQLLADLADAIKRHPGQPALVDGRGIGETVSATELYQIVGEIADYGVGAHGRLAVVTRPRPDFDRGAFLEELAGRRGLAIRHFPDPAEALAWLRE